MNLSPSLSGDYAQLRQQLGERHVVLIGLMGAGKTSIGKRLAQKMEIPFVDSDHAIEESARMSIPEIFATRGEEEFRAGERKVIARLLEAPQQVIATGGGAFMDETTRALVGQKAVSIWLRAELPVLMRRVLRRNNRPLLKNGDPEATMRLLMEKRYPVYGEANICVESGEGGQDEMTEHTLNALRQFLRVDPSIGVDDQEKKGDSTNVTIIISG